MAILGCTSPFGRNKSTICTDKEKSIQALDIFENLTIYNVTYANNRCPESCSYQMTTFGNVMNPFKGEPNQGHLSLKFQNLL